MEGRESKYDLSYQLSDIRDDAIKKRKIEHEREALLRRIEYDKINSQYDIIAKSIVEDFSSIFKLPKSLEIVSYLYEWEPYNKFWYGVKTCKRDVPFHKTKGLVDGTYSGNLKFFVEKRLKIKYPSHLHDQGMFEASIYGHPGAMDYDGEDNGLCIKLRELTQ